jgi:hypothetical protein
MDYYFFPSSSLLSLIFEISDLILSDWVSFLAYPNLFGIKGFDVLLLYKFSIFFYDVHSKVY